MKFAIAATIGTVCFAPPNAPSYWTEPDQENIRQLIQNCIRADEITLEDSHLVMTLIGKSVALDTFMGYINMKIEKEPERRMSWDDVKFEVQRVEKSIKEELKKREDETKKQNAAREQPRGKDA